MRYFFELVRQFYNFQLTEQESSSLFKFSISIWDQMTNEQMKSNKKQFLTYSGDLKSDHCKTGVLKIGFLFEQKNALNVVSFKVKTTSTTVQMS